ncbi:MAG: 4a-hydroxytetrahydrobiopterin dehydratase [Cellvibrionaceae bacterium]
MLAIVRKEKFMSSKDTQLLSAQVCEACRPDAPMVSELEQVELLAQLSDWTISLDKNAVQQLAKEYKFANFAEALTFSNHVGALAEEVGHHPAILTEWGKVNVRWWSHEIGGLHKSDFIMAAKTDLIII